MDERFPCAVMVLAAGASRRMGQPKQLLDVGGVPLLRRVVQAAVEANVGHVWIVLGANAEKIRPSLAGLSAELVVNENWEEGMGSSIRAGMAAIDVRKYAMSGVLVTLGDQPRISADHIARLYRTLVPGGRSIVASRCAGKLMPPVLFGPVHFPALRNLQGDAGARGLLQMNPDQIATIDTDDLGDLDTPDDYAALVRPAPRARG